MPQTVIIMFFSAPVEYWLALADGTWHCEMCYILSTYTMLLLWCMHAHFNLCFLHLFYALSCWVPCHYVCDNSKYLFMVPLSLAHTLVTRVLLRQRAFPGKGDKCVIRPDSKYVTSHACCSCVGQLMTSHIKGHVCSRENEVGKNPKLELAM